MDLLQMKCFLAVAKNLSFTKASEWMCISQSAVSKRISSLEEELGIMLFHRTQHVVTLTAAGSILKKSFEEIIKSIDNAIESAQKYGKGLSGEIKVGFPGLMDIKRIIPDFFEQFSKKFPNINIIVETREFNELWEMLNKEELDIIFTYSFEQRDNPLICRVKLCRSNSRLYYSKDIRAVCDIKQPLFTNFKNEKLILLHHKESLGARDFILNIYKRYNMEIPPIIEVNTMEAMLFHLEAGTGIAILGNSYRVSFGNSIRSIELKDIQSMVGTDALWFLKNTNPSLHIFEKCLKEHLSKCI